MVLRSIRSVIPTNMYDEFCGLIFLDIKRRAGGELARFLLGKLEFSGECSAYCNPKSGVKGDASPLRVEGRALVAVRRNTPHEVRYSARRRAVKTFKSAKGVWGKTRVFPHKQHIKSSRDYPPKQSGGLFRKNITHLNSSFLSQAAFRL